MNTQLSDAALTQLLCTYWLTHCIQIRTKASARLSTALDLVIQCEADCRRRGASVKIPVGVMRQAADELGIPRIRDWYCVEFLIDDSAAKLQAFLGRVSG